MKTTSSQEVRANSVRSTGVVLARNTVYNFLTQILVIVIALVSIPLIVRHLGEDAFGLLTMAWLVVGYFSIFDLGMGQAGVKYLSEQIANDEVAEANTTITVSVAVSTVFGVLTTVVMIALIPFITKNLLHIPDALLETARFSFMLAAAAVPFVMLQGAFRAVPAALQRFDYINLIQGLSGVFQWGGSLVVVWFGGGLIGVIVLTVIIRVLGAVLSYWMAIRLFPEISFRRATHVRTAFLKLFKFGGWLTVSQLVAPVVRYLDRVMVASYYSLRLFTFYSVPYEAASRLQLIPSSLSTTLYPALAERDGLRGSDGSLVVSLYFRSMKLMIIAMLPVSIVLMVFSREILQMWLGGSFPAMSSTVFSILALATFFQAIGYVPVTLLQSIGRPDLAARFYLAEIPLYIILCFALIPPYGIEGAASAWLIRLIVILPALLWTAGKQLKIGVTKKRSRGLQRPLLLNGIFLCFMMGIYFLAHNPIVQSMFVAGTAVVYLLAVWRYCFDDNDRKIVNHLLFRKGTS